MVIEIGPWFFGAIVAAPFAFYGARLMCRYVAAKLGKAGLYIGSDNCP